MNEWEERRIKEKKYGWFEIEIVRKWIIMENLERG